MKIREHVSLAPLTTMGVGGEARFLIEAHDESEIREAIAFARERALPLFVLGGGSNSLVPDEGVDGVVLKILMRNVTFQDDGDETILVADAGALWEEIVDAANARGLFGIENLAGIPGTAGGAVVQNIGAYGAELSHVFDSADTILCTTGAHVRIARADADFGYRTSFFKKDPAHIVTRVALRLSRKGTLNLSYPDLARILASSTALSTPSEISRAIRAIRAEKFPCAPERCAGSFFKNPCILPEHADTLKKKFPDLPLFPQEDGTMKVALAWLLDKALALKGYAEGPVRLYEKQPLVLVARAGATAAAIDAFAFGVKARVFDTTGIVLEREVETFGAPKEM